MAHHCTGWHCLAQTIFGGFSSRHCAIQHSDCQETYSSSPSPSTPILHLFPAPFAQQRLAHKWFVHPGLIHLWLEPDGGPSPDPYLPWRPLSTSHHSFCSPPSRRHSIPTAISTICAVTRQLLPPRSESYRAAFPLVTPPSFFLSALLCQSDNSSFCLSLSNFFSRPLCLDQEMRFRKPLACCGFWPWK